MTVAMTEKRAGVQKPPKRIFRVNIDCSKRLPNSETLEAMREIEDMISGKISSHPQSVESLFEELGINVHR